MVKLFKENSAITLIALIITVIVMLILAGIVINLTIGDNGIFSKSQQAVETYKIASAKEKIELSITSYQMNKENTTLLDEFKKIEGISFIQTQDDNRLPYTVIVDGYEFVIDENLNIIYQDKKMPSTPIQPEVSLNYETGEVYTLNMTVSAKTKDSLGLKEIIVSYQKVEEGNLTYEDIKHEAVNGKEVSLTVEIPINGDYVVQVIGNNGTIAKKEFTITNIKEDSILATIRAGEVNQNQVLLTIRGESEGLPIEKIELYVAGKKVKTYQYEDNQLQQEETFTLEHMEFYQDLTCYAIVTNSKNKTATSVSKIVKNIDTIETLVDLENLASLVNNGNAFSEKTIYLISDITTGANWTPIGFYDGIGSFTGMPFSGNFEGNQHTITISSLSKSDTYKSSGLFGMIISGAVNNLKVRGNIDAACDFVGGIVGAIKDTTLSNCSNINNITVFSSKYNSNYNFHGGIVGFAVSSSIIQCDNADPVAGNTFVGGICGSADTNVRIANCKNSGSIVCSGTSEISWANHVSGSFGTVGGICGFLLNSKNNYGITGCTNAGNLSFTSERATSTVKGGIVGWAQNSSISQSKNEGVITSSHPSGLGGIAGALTTNSVLEQCCNVNTIGNFDPNYQNTGGIVGYMSDSILKNTYNTANIRGYLYVGGLVGVIESLDSRPYVYNSYNTNSSILGQTNVGNVFGSSNSTTGSHIFWISGQSPIGLDNSSTWTDSAEYTLDQMKQTIFFTSLSSGNGNGVWQQSSSVNNGLPYLKYTP